MGPRALLNYCQDIKLYQASASGSRDFLVMQKCHHKAGKAGQHHLRLASRGSQNADELREVFKETADLGLVQSQHCFSVRFG